MHGTFFIRHVTTTPDNWIVNLLVTFAGVGLALLGQELLSWFHRKRKTLEFARHLIAEANANIVITQSIITSCDDMLKKLAETPGPFGFPMVFSISGVTLTLKKDAYETVKANNPYLTWSVEVTLEIAKAYSRLSDIGFFLSTMISTWESSEKEANNAEVSRQIIDQQRRNQTNVILSGTKAIALEAQSNLKNVVSRLSGLLNHTRV